MDRRDGAFANVLRELPNKALQADGASRRR